MMNARFPFLFPLHEMTATHHSTIFFFSVLFCGMDFCFVGGALGARGFTIVDWLGVIN